MARRASLRKGLRRPGGIYPVRPVLVRKNIFSEVSGSRRADAHSPAHPKEERRQQSFTSQGSAQRLLSAHGPIYNLFNSHQHLISRKPCRTFQGRAWEECASRPKPPDLDFPRCPRRRSPLRRRQFASAL